MLTGNHFVYKIALEISNKDRIQWRYSTGPTTSVEREPVMINLSDLCSDICPQSKTSDIGPQLLSKR